MIDMYITSGMLQSILTNSYLNHGKKRSFEDVVIELYKKKNFSTIKPRTLEKPFWTYLSDDEFLDLLNSTPIYINTLLENMSSINSSEKKEAIRLPRQHNDIYVTKQHNYMYTKMHSQDYFQIIYVFKGNCEFQFEK